MESGISDIAVKMRRDYAGKKFSVLGDSITTLEGYSPDGYRVYYCGWHLKKTGVTRMEDTWWGKVINFFGGTLLKNNSWSGSRVAKAPDSDGVFPSACSDERTGALGDGETSPDVIIIYLGANDWEKGAVPGVRRPAVYGEVTGKSAGGFETGDIEVFSVAYDLMLKKLKRNYPNAEIWCLTMAKTYVSSDPSHEFITDYAGYPVYDYNDAIKSAAFENGCHIADLYSFGWAYDSVDGSHPTAEGMRVMANMICRCMCADAGEFLDCKGKAHEYIHVESYTGGEKFVCRHCGRVRHDLTV